jgi:hypothetical protein
MSDRCTDYCTGNGRFPRGHPETTEADMQAMMAVLYMNGYGYAQIADLSGRSHEEVAGLLVANFPARAQSSPPKSPRAAAAGD